MLNNYLFLISITTITIGIALFYSILFSLPPHRGAMGLFQIPAKDLNIPYFNFPSPHLKPAITDPHFLEKDDCMGRPLGPSVTLLKAVFYTILLLPFDHKGVQ